MLVEGRRHRYRARPGSPERLTGTAETRELQTTAISPQRGGGRGTRGAAPGGGAAPPQCRGHGGLRAGAGAAGRAGAAAGAAGGGRRGLRGVGRRAGARQVSGDRRLPPRPPRRPRAGRRHRRRRHYGGHAGVSATVRGLRPGPRAGPVPCRRRRVPPARTRAKRGRRWLGRGRPSLLVSLLSPFITYVKSFKFSENAYFVRARCGEGPGAGAGGSGPNPLCVPGQT